MSNKSLWLQDTEHDTAQGLAEKQAAVLAAINMTPKRTKRPQPEGKLTQPPGKQQTVSCLAGCVSDKAASMAQLGDLNCAQVPQCYARLES